MRQKILRNRTGWMISAVTMLFSLAVWATPAQAADSVVVIPMGSHGAPVAKTGQTTSSMPGDDGALQKGVSVSSRFNDNGNGTVTDHLTGLIWLKKGNCFSFYSGDPNGILGANERTWANAILAANNLASGYCELSDGSKAGDWRLPNRKEFESLMDLGHFNPALPVSCTLAASTMLASYYWSSTTNAGDSGLAWMIHFSYGDATHGIKSSNYYVRAVRGGQ